MNSVKLINVKNHTYCFFHDMINIKNVDPNKIKIDEQSYKNILIYRTGYVTVKDFTFTTINNVNPLYLIINKVNGYIGKGNRNKFLTLVLTDKIKTH